LDISSKYTTINGINTHYHEDGSGNKEKMVLIHGSGPGVSALANWRLVIPKLSESVHVFAPDIVGFGNTDKVNKDEYTLDLWVNHLISFIESISDEPVYLIGNSFGGALSLHVAQRRPDLVKKMMLMGTVGVQHELSHGLDRVWGYEPSIQSMRELISLFSYDEKAAKNEELVRMRYEASMEPKTRDAFAEMFFDDRQKRLDELALPDQDIQKIQTETLLFHGLNDRVIPFEETSYKLVRLLPHSELHLFNECGHWTQIEKTDSFIDHVLAFLKN